MLGSLQYRTGFNLPPKVLKMHLKEIKNIFQKELASLYSGREIDSFFYILIDHYLHLERFVLVLNPELVISREDEQPLFEALAQLKLERPIQYITGETSFMDLPFTVNEKVLIPRPETAELLQWIISEYEGKPKAGNGKLKILDIGTGSGCIAITLAKYLTHAQVYALDYSEEIIAIAAANARRNGVTIQFIQADLFELEEQDERFDIIVSNPPYVREKEKQLMQNNVLDYEPARALFVKDEAPLVFYERIAQLAVKNLKEDGALFLEINQYLGEETAAVLKAHGFIAIELRKDLFGNFRMLRGSRSLSKQQIGSDKPSE